MPKPIRIAILGVSGRMGQMLVRAVAENQKVMLVGVTERPGHDWIGKDIGIMTSGKQNGIIVSDKPINVFVNTDAVIDFTSPEATVAHSILSAQARIIHVIGTTGFSKEQIKKIEIASQHAIIIRAGNMSLGINMLTQLTKQVSAALDDQYDIEIVEMHHNKKLDAPSGTALMLGGAAAKGRQISLNNPSSQSIFDKKSERARGEIGFASIRGGDVVGEHDVIFSAPGERIVLRHIATDRMIFARGAIKAAIWGIKMDPGNYDMIDVLGLTK